MLIADQLLCVGITKQGTKPKRPKEQRLKHRDNRKQKKPLGKKGNEDGDPDGDLIYVEEWCTEDEHLESGTWRETG